MKLTIALLLIGAASGCMMPNLNRLIPENKDANVFIVTPYGQAIIQTRVNPRGTEKLPPLSTEMPSLKVE